MIIETKTLTYNKPEEFKLFGDVALRERIKNDIKNEFDSYYGNIERISKYDFTKVARTSFLGLDFSCLSFKNSEVVFEIFEMDHIEEEKFITRYKKGKVLEKMVLNIVFE